MAAALDGVSKPTGLNVHRQRTRPIEKDGLPAQVLYLLNEDTEERAAGQIDRRARFAVESRVTASGESPDAALDEYLSWAVKALRADPTLGGLSSDVKERGTEWDHVELDKVFGAARTIFEVHYQTADDDPETL